MLRGQQISQEARQYIGHIVFVSAHAYQGSSTRQYRGTLIGVNHDSLVFQGGYVFPVDTLAYDVMLSVA